MSKHTWPREPEVIESEDGLSTTITANGNPLGITFWSWEVRSGEWFVADGTSQTRRGSLVGSFLARRAYRRNGYCRRED